MRYDVHYVVGDLDVSGSITGASKSNIEHTESYGEVLLTVRESPDQRYIDEGIGTLVNGIGKIDIDPIFIECIEQNNPATRWGIDVTPYGKVNIYVDEIGDNYFIIKDFDGTANGIDFKWTLSATRKNYTGIRFPIHVPKKKRDKEVTL